MASDPLPSQPTARRAVDVVLRDGTTVRVRPVRSDDAVPLLQFFRGLSPASRAQRFFADVSDDFLAEAARREAAADGVRRVGLVATTGSPERIIGHGVYALVDGDRAEVAFVVADDYQGRGVGTILLAELAEAAAASGVQVFEAYVLPANHQMIAVFRDSGFPIEVRAGTGELVVTFPTQLSPEALERFRERDRIAAINAVRWFFRPRSIAVIGASRQRGTISGEVFHNLLTSGFPGPVYPVNPAAAVVQSVPAYRSVELIPGPVDLAVITVPAEHVLEVARQCARKGVRALVVISAGFAEIGEEGRQRQRQLVEICRAAGMRLVGPNCMGILSTDPECPLNATFSPVMPPPGKIGFYSQSGALGLAVIDYAASLGLGMSGFVSIGNKADISGNDLLEYWEADPRTTVILMYLESFGNPRKFSRIARRVGRSKPIVVVKSGRSPAGARATSSHTGALLAASDITVDALFRQAGVIRTDTLEEMFDVAALLATQPPPRGRRVAIVTNAGGPGILCADACEAEGLVVPVLEERTQSRLREILPPEASTANPVDLIASATPDQYRQAIRIVADDPQVGAVIVIFIPPLVTRAEDVAEAIVAAAREINGRTTLLTVFMSSRGVPEILRRPDVGLPSYAFPESAAIALARVARYGEWRGRPPAAPVELEGLRRDEAAAVVAQALGRGEGWLTPREVEAVLAAYGLPLARQRVVASPADAAAAAEELGCPVALKAVAPGVVHKTDLGGVRLRLEGAEAVRRAAEEMTRALAAAGHRVEGFVVQEMVPEGVEMLVGVVSDLHFGPVVACGAGGVMVEVLRDVSVRLTPLGRDDARSMIEELKIAPVLRGFRGRPPMDVAALEDAILRVAALVEDLPQVVELDCNPIIVHPHGAAVVDARIRVASVTPPPPFGFVR
ncbi:MAG: GNAT family N-acetyltransferase [Armatimonadota bacterium]|nr:GNAT family N-acetyltransferase [Armatimonadota bacterium]MDR7516217.1 GNAT family N-acetyltransferase [Armatimonadota bacterium]MDR7560230.1 GNAT family N-acetyltransferase [Armatimonadota bacterium]MDR7589050.1 GNAT family N-acetyltransferase [Armatimonadota bacterium]MDR7611817.1 GNAT family N-acetyltransferase [Armatimonadota bacterium]